ncbi:LysR substrate-binding domain-containing protein, partial [Escherichia coli]
DAENQLSQFQTDLIIDNMFCTNRTVQHHVLFTDNMVLICREGNPLLSLEDDRETIDNAAHVLLLPEGQNFSGLRQRIQEMFPDRQISFTSYNILTIAALVANSDMLAIIPSRFYNLFSRCWPLEKLPFPSLNEEQIDFSIHYNKFSLRDPILHGVIDVIRNAF